MYATGTLKLSWSVVMHFFTNQRYRGLTYDEGFEFFFRISSAASENHQGSVDDVTRAG